MTLEEAISHLRESLADTAHEWGCEECKAEHEQLLAFLQELKLFRETFGDVKNTKFCVQECKEAVSKIRKLETENAELKRLLRLAVDDLDKSIKACETDMLCEICSYEAECNCVNYCFIDKNLRSWRHHDEAMKLLGGTENAEN